MPNIEPRALLRKISPYIPGKSIESVRREFGLKNVIKLASNENPLGASPRAISVYRKSSKDCFLYPEGASPELRKALARLHQAPEDSVLIGNGSDEIIRLLCEAFLDEEHEALTSQYAFIRFRQQSLLMGARIIEVPMKNWKLDLEAMAGALSERTRLVFIPNPNNPTGTYNSQKELEKFIARLPPKVILILDEAYYHYARLEKNYPNSIPLWAPRLPNVAVLRTFSKAYGLAGLRVGYVVTNPEIVGWLDRIRMPFNVSLPAQRACIAAIQDHRFVSKGVSLNLKEKIFLEKSLVHFGFEIIPSACNFVFAKSPILGKELFQKLLKNGIIIRPLDEYGLSSYVRISIGRRSDHLKLIKVLESILK